jgi:nitrogen fixation/metabolism regulation signal transduction histidine kinase
MNLLTNPMVLRLIILFGGTVFAFVMAVFMIRHMRRTLVESCASVDEKAPLDNLPMHTYHAVIQQLKQQKHELLSTQQVERRRAKTSENISASVLSNLSIGVMFFAPSGLIRQANSAAKEILGFSSPIGMNAASIFANTNVVSKARFDLSNAIRASLEHVGSPESFEAEHMTPSGDLRTVRITIASVRSAAGDVLGAACLIDDRSEVSTIRRQQQLRGEMSAEMALELRNSLATISGYGRQLAVSHDAELAKQLATDIAAEASHLDHTIGGFLVGAGHKSQS